jgi:hypothetical protein
VLVEQFSDDFIFLLDFGLKSDDFAVFGILLLGRLAGRLKYQSRVICKLLLPCVDLSRMEPKFVTQV